MRRGLMITYNEKQRTYSLWSRRRIQPNWEKYTKLRAAVKRVYDAVDDFNTNLYAGASQSHKWWYVLKTASPGNDSAMAPPREDVLQIMNRPRKLMGLL